MNAPAIITCDKCGAEITTGLMALFCSLKRDCEFWSPAVDEFIKDWQDWQDPPNV